MRKIYFLILLVSGLLFSQESKETTAIDIDYARGNILPHTNEIHHLISGHPEGVLVSFSRQTHGGKEWERVYGNPDYGMYFLYQDFKNQFLGKSYALGAHYNFYFLNRNLMFKMASGLAMTTNPYDKESNSKNGAMGSKFMGNINLMLAYKKENIIDKFGAQAGLLFTHFSNGRIKSPNSGINTYNINLGVNYNLDEPVKRALDTIPVNLKFNEPVRYNFVLRTGFNESSVAGSGQFPFYHVGFYADKRVNRKSAWQLGTEIFFSDFYKEYIRYRAIAFPEENIDPDTDYKRVGVFAGHELFINRLSLELQVGYYVYEPYKDDIPFYDRLGLKYYLSKKIFTGISLKTHLFVAEALEFVIGARI
ncbi:MAG: acyloxyacyl hydrolase [Flavobacterium sp.]